MIMIRMVIYTDFCIIATLCLEGYWSRFYYYLT